MKRTKAASLAAAIAFSATAYSDEIQVNLGDDCKVVGYMGAPINSTENELIDYGNIICEDGSYITDNDQNPIRHTSTNDGKSVILGKNTGKIMEQELPVLYAQ